MIQFQGTLEDIASVENLLAAWTEFVIGKRNKADVQEFSLHLMDHIFSIHRDLISRNYRHGPYRPFNISDPKPRNIHKALVRDRLIHHAIYRKLYPFFDRTFIAHSYSCRVDKGTHRAMDCFRAFARKESANHTKTVWVLKCDIRKFFATIDHVVLSKILRRQIPDGGINWLLNEIIRSFPSDGPSVGLPLGNLTSQLLVNIYMNEFDQFMKCDLRIKYYLRYADDFAILSRDRKHLENLIPKINAFLDEHLKLALHPDKVCIKSFASGVDFLGWVHFLDHRVVRTASKQRMFRGLKNRATEQVVASYTGMLTHGNATRLARHIKENFSFLFEEGAEETGEN